jgi:hypothetical protein
MKLKAQISQPAMGEVLPAGAEYRVFGAAWGGSNEVAAVEVSTDGGANWSEAKLLGEAVPNAWRLWEFAWTTPAEPGRYRLIARAKDSAGRTQPIERDANHGTYMIDHWLPIEVEVL